MPCHVCDMWSVRYTDIDDVYGLQWSLYGQSVSCDEQMIVLRSDDDDHSIHGLGGDWGLKIYGRLGALEGGGTLCICFFGLFSDSTRVFY